ncbi:hypothetical protein RHGRI_031593 [Rhododendron griersonianum]|uniref:WRKY domain-containing protein n=1 Tax=Rhododendron griersonianum TaxID=479676 RepID=A0AAV6IE83_9ERIC|nr:hypothetical protein RHGRI_031593 [Rhododendron griersonianum]
MDSNLLKNLLARRENAVHELTEGFELASQLRAIINEPFGTDRSVEAGDLIGKILRSFADTISLLNSGKAPDPSLANPGAPLNTLGTSRRKNPSSRKRITPNLPDDGHVWRQCRRKEVHNPRYPRSDYYECTYRTSQGCLAKKLVQRTEDNPLMYQTTYTNHHTCNNRLKAPPRVIFDSTTPTDPIKSAFGLGSSKCPNDELKDPSYPTSTKTHHPPVIISSYRT